MTDLKRGADLWARMFSPKTKTFVRGGILQHSVSQPEYCDVSFLRKLVSRTLPLFLWELAKKDLSTRVGAASPDRLRRIRSNVSGFRDVRTHFVSMFHYIVIDAYRRCITFEHAVDVTYAMFVEILQCMRSR